jgi:GGDEF domain-containing protein
VGLTSSTTAAYTTNRSAQHTKLTGFPNSRMIRQCKRRQQQRCSRAALLCAVAFTAAALAAVNAQSTQQEASMSSIPQGIARMTKIDDALEQLLRPVRRQGLPWSDNMSEMLRKHLNQNIQVRWASGQTALG